MIFPNQSIFSLLIVPNSFNLVNAHIEANKPIGILIQKINLHPRYDVKNPPKVRPITDPITIEIWFNPNALPLSFSGNTSVIIAALFENKNAAHIDWTNLKIINCYPE